MSKKRKEEERKIIEEFEKALGQVRDEREKESENPPQTAQICKRCGNACKDGKCSVCGYSEYQPMDEKRQRKYKLIIGGVCLALFALIYVLFL